MFEPKSRPEIEDDGERYWFFRGPFNRIWRVRMIADKWFPRVRLYDPHNPPKKWTEDIVECSHCESVS